LSYNGFLEIKLESDEEVAELYEGRMVLQLKTNQYLIVRNKDNEIIDKKRWDGEKLVSLSSVKIKGFKAKTYKQECLFDLLSNKNIPIKIIAGVPGSGKSKISIVFGSHFLNRGDYERIFLVRHNVGIGEKNGYLKGTKEDKIMGWLGFFRDNWDGQETIEELCSNGSIELEGVEFIKGRDIQNSWCMIDECEDLTESQFKVIGERVSYGSAICFIGDYEQVTQEKYKQSNGLIRAIKNLAGNPHCGIVVFDDKENDNVRSEVSRIFTNIY